VSLVVVAAVVTGVLVLLLWIDFVSGLVRAAGSPSVATGYDLRAFHAAAGAVLRDRGAALYDPGLTGAASAPRFVHPPFLALLVLPIGAVPFEVAYALWVAGSLLALWLGSRWLDAPRGSWLLLLLTLPALVAVELGQTTMFAFLLLAGAYRAAARGRARVAGVALGLLGFKPQLLLGPAAWVGGAWRRRRPVAVAALGTVGLLAAVSVLLLPEAWRAYPGVITSLPGLYAGGGGRRFDMSLGGAVAAAFPAAPPAVTAGVALVGGLLLVAGFVGFLRRGGDVLEVSFAGAVAVSVAASPHVNLYDWLLLAIPLLLLWRAVPSLRTRWALLGVAVAATALFSALATALELAAFGRAVQVGPFLLVLFLVLTARALTREARAADPRRGG